MSELDPSDRVVVISGAGTGIGQATAVRFAGLGWRVAVGGRRVDKLEETVELVEKAGGRCFAHRLDVANGDSVASFFEATTKALGTPTAVINNAATARYGPIETFSPEEIQLEIATKMVGSLLMAAEGIRGMQRDSIGGDLLFVTSASAVLPWLRHLPYAAANAGVEHAARILRLELEGTGIRVSVFRCGETMGTDFGTREMASERMMAANEEWFRHGLIRHTGLMDPEMVAEAIVHTVTLPRTYQYDVVAVSPMAPIGEAPRTYEDWGMRMATEYSEG